MDGELKENSSWRTSTRSGDREGTKMYQEEASQQFCWGMKRRYIEEGDKPAIYALGELPSHVKCSPQTSSLVHFALTYVASYVALLICWGIRVRTVGAFLLWRCSLMCVALVCPTAEVITCWRPHRRTQPPGWRTQPLVDVRFSAQPKAWSKKHNSGALNDYGAQALQRLPELSPKAKLYMNTNIPQQIQLGLWYALQIIFILRQLLVASLFARDGGACNAWPGLVAQNGEPPRTHSIYATDAGSGWLGIAKYKRRNANNNKRRCKLRNAKCEMQSAKCKVRNASATADANVDAVPSCTYLPQSFYLLPPLLQPPSLFLSSANSDSQLGTLRDGLGDVQMATQLCFN